MKRILIFSFLLVFAFSTYATAQDEERDEDGIANSSGSRESSSAKNPNRKKNLSKINVGGVLGFSYQSYSNGHYLRFDFWPDISYAVHPRIRIGGGPIYSFEQSSNFGNKFTMHTAGGRAWVRGFIFEGLFAQVEGQILNSNPRNDNNVVDLSQRCTAGQVLLGGGYSAAIGGSSGIYISVLAPMIINCLNPDRYPIISIGFGVGL